MCYPSRLAGGGQLVPRHTSKPRLRLLPTADATAWPVCRDRSNTPNHPAIEAPGPSRSPQIPNSRRVPRLQKLNPNSSSSPSPLHTSKCVTIQPEDPACSSLGVRWKPEILIIWILFSYKMSKKNQTKLASQMQVMACGGAMLGRGLRSTYRSCKHI